MKRLFLVLFVSVFALSAAAQVKQEVISSAGGDNSAPDLSIAISWTLGETIIPNYKASDNSIQTTHVFQYKVIITDVEDNIDTPVKVTVYPNPTSEDINIIFEEPVDAEITLVMINSQGKPVKTDVIETMAVEKMLNLQDLPSGIYFLKLTKGKLVNIYKVVKL